MPPENVIRLMKALTTQETPADARADALLAVLGDHVRKVLSDISTEEAFSELRSSVGAINSHREEDVVHQVVALCLALLRRLREELTRAAETSATTAEDQAAGQRAVGEHQAPKLPPDVLSFDQRTTVTAVLQFVLALAVLPGLVPGLGGSAEERTRHGAGLLKMAATRPCARLFRRAVDGLLDVSQHGELGSLLLSRYLADLLAALIQLAKDRRASDTPEGGGCSSALCNRSMAGNDGDQEGRERAGLEGSDAERSHYRVRMNALLKSVYKPLLVSEIFVLLHRARTMPGPRPDWLARTCGELLTAVLRGSDGVRNVVSGILFSGDQSWQQCEAAGLVIATCPSSSKPDEYYKLIAPQVMSLLCGPSSAATEPQRMIASSIVNAMASRHLPEMKAHLWSLLTGPLVSYDEAGVLEHDTAHQENARREEAFGTPARVIEKSIGNLFKVLCGGGGQPSTRLCQMIGDVLPCLFEVLCTCCRTAWMIRTECEELLQCHLRALERGPTAAAAFRQLAQLASQRPCQHDGTTFSVDADGHLGLSTCCCHDAAACTCRTLDFIDSHVACLVNLVRGCRDDDLSSEFFLFLLQELNSVLDTDTSDDEKLDADRATAGRDGAELSHLSYKIVVTRLVAVAYETMGNAICSAKPAHVLTFAKLTLERWMRLRQAEAETDWGMFEMDTLTLALGLVLAPLSDKDALLKLTEEDWNATNGLLPLLVQLEKLSQRAPLISQLAFAARTAIATRGRVSAPIDATAERPSMPSPMPRSLSASKATQKADEPASHHLAQKPAPSDAGADEAAAAAAATTERDVADDNVGDICRPGTEAGDETSPTAQQQQWRRGRAQPQPSLDSLCDALACLAAEDSLLPLRAHALIAVRRHVERGSAEALARAPELLSACERHMNDGDSYVYLAAINCLAALADRFSESVLPVVARKFANPPPGYSSLDRLKLGEALVKTIRAMGDMAPKYRDLLLPALLSGVRSDDELVRASSLANLSETCRLLRYSLAGHVHEILSCARCAARTDRSAAVRQAATSVVGHLLRGIASTGGALTAAQSILGADVLRDVYRDLRHLRDSDADAGVRQQADLACAEVDMIVAAAFSESAEMKKRIWVLDAPPELP